MKKRVAIEKIQEKLNGGFDPNHSYYDAEQFLTFLQEELGMFPPYNPNSTDDSVWEE